MADWVPQLGEDVGIAGLLQCQWAQSHSNLHESFSLLDTQRRHPNSVPTTGNGH